MSYSSNNGVSASYDFTRSSRSGSICFRYCTISLCSIFASTNRESTWSENRSRMIPRVRLVSPCSNAGARAEPALLQGETSLTRGIIRDLFSDKVDSLLVDSKALHTEERVDLENRSRMMPRDRKSTRLNSSHVRISYAVFCLQKKKYPD